MKYDLLECFAHDGTHLACARIPLAPFGRHIFDVGITLKKSGNISGV